jgi:hypothetical protein
VPFVSAPSSGHTGTKCWGTDLNGNYENNANELLTSPMINLSGYTNAYLSFYIYVDCETYWDGAELLLSSNGSTFSKEGLYPGFYDSTSIVSLNSSGGWDGDSEGWIKKIIDISSYAGDQFWIRFHFDTDGSVTSGTGFFIDTIEINDTIDVSGTGLVTFSTATIPPSYQDLLNIYYRADFSLTDASLRLIVPNGWSTPQAVNSSLAGYVRVYTNANNQQIGEPAVSGSGPWTISIPITNMSAGSSITVALGDTSEGGPGITTPSTPGASTFTISLKSSTGSYSEVKGSPTDITITNYAGFGSSSANPEYIVRNQTNTLRLNYFPNINMDISNVTVAYFIPSVFSKPQFTNSSILGYIDLYTNSSLHYQYHTVTSNNGYWQVTFNNLYIAKYHGLNIRCFTISPDTVGIYNFPVASASYGTALQGLEYTNTITVVSVADGLGDMNTTGRPFYVGDDSLIIWDYNFTCFMQSPSIGVTVPIGWSPPQTSNPLGEGYIFTGDDIFNNAEITNIIILGNGPWTVVFQFNGNVNNGEDFDIYYSHVRTPLSAGPYWFQASSMDQGGILTSLYEGTTYTPLDNRPDYGTVSLNITNCWVEERLTLQLTYQAGMAITNQQFRIYNPRYFDANYNWTLFNNNFPTSPGYITATSGLGLPEIGTLYCNPSYMYLIISNMQPGDTIVFTYGNSNTSLNGQTIAPANAGYSLFMTRLEWNWMGNYPAITIQEDTTAPVLADTIFPGPDTWIRGIVTAYGLISEEESPLSSVLISINNGPANNIGMAAAGPGNELYWSNTINTTLMPDGTNQITITASNSKGSVIEHASNTYPLLVDNTKPMVQNAEIIQTNAAYVIFNITGLDASSGVTAYVVSNTNNGMVNIDSTPNVVASGLQPFSSYGFIIWVRDAAGNLSSNQITNSVSTINDVTPPVFSYLELNGVPYDSNAWYGGQIEFLYKLSEDKGEVSNQALLLVSNTSGSTNTLTNYGQLQVQNATNGIYSSNFNSTLLTDGQALLSLAAQNTFGISMSNYSIINIDNTPPQITSSISGTKVYIRSTNVQISASDNMAFSTIQYTINGGTKVTTSQSSINIILTVPGEYDIHASAYDMAGNYSTTIFQITVLTTLAPDVRDYLQQRVQNGKSATTILNKTAEYVLILPKWNSGGLVTPSSVEIFSRRGVPIYSFSAADLYLDIISWDKKNQNSEQVQNGVYVIRITYADGTEEWLPIVIQEEE